MCRSLLSQLLLVVLLLLVASTSAETILTDSCSNGVTLPTTGGDAVSSLTMLDPLVSTSPYYLYVALNNGAARPTGSIAGEREYFYITSVGQQQANSSRMSFGSATLMQQMWSEGFVQDQGVVGEYVSGVNNATGLYTLVFHIPAGEWLVLNLTYMQTNSNPRPITENISLFAIFNPVFITGDPQFVGLRGQSYQVHGIDGAVYNIISEQSSQVNARFVFLTEGACPVINGVVGTNCWSHPGSYLGEMSFQVVVDGRLHAALVQSGPAANGFSAVQVDGVALAVGDRVVLGEFVLEYTSSHGVSVTTESFDFALHNSDEFINQAVKARVPLSHLSAHGLLGQTHSAATYRSSLKYIEGDVDDYVIQDNDIFGTDFLFNQFHPL